MPENYFFLQEKSKSEKIPNIRDYLLIVRKSLRLFVLTFLIIVGSVALWNFSATPYYRSTVQVLIAPEDAKVTKFQQVMGSDARVLRDYHLTQYRLISSRTLIKRVVNKLQLTKKEGYGVTREVKKYSLQNFRRVIATPIIQFGNLGKGLVAGFVGGAEGEEMPSPKKLSVASTPEDRAVRAVFKRLEIEPIARSRLINIHFQDSDPVLVAKVLNSIAEEFVDMNFELRFSATKDALAKLRKEIVKARQAVVKSQEGLQKYSEKYNIVSLQGRQNIVEQKLAEASSAASRAKTERISLEVLAARARKVNGKITDINSLPEFSTNPIIEKLKGEYIDLQRQLSDLSRRYKPRHPKMIRLRSTIRLMEKKILEEVHEVAKSVLTRYQVALAQERSLLRSLEDRKKEAHRLGRLAIQYEALKQDSETNRKLYDSLLMRAKETGVLEEINTTNIRIVDRANVPKKPAGPNVLLNLSVSVVGSLLIAFVFVFFAEGIDNTVRSPEEVEAITEAPTIGVMPDLGKKIGEADPLLIREEKNQAIGREHFNLLRAMAQFELGHSRKVVQFTSCIPGEGKSFIAANLAMAMSKGEEKKVLLIDGDLKRPKVDKIFDIVPTRNIVDVLAKNVDVEKAIYQVPGSSLHLISGGEYMGNSSVLLDSPKVRSIIEKLKDEYDYIIIDSPPVLSITDPMIWSKIVDGIFFVVDLQKVTPDMLRQAMTKINRIHAPLLGSISNRLTKLGPYYYYGYDKQSNHYFDNKETE